MYGLIATVESPAIKWYLLGLKSCLFSNLGKIDDLWNTYES